MRTFAGLDGPVLQVLPRGMRYSIASATSIDLFVSEVVAHSSLRMEVVAESCKEPLAAPAVHDLPDFRFANTIRRAMSVAAIARRMKPVAIVVQQHLPSAAAIAARVKAPVILQKHNFVRPPRGSGPFSALSRRVHVKQFNLLAGITFVSEAVRAQFEADWPEVTTRRCVVTNGIDLGAWSPRCPRSKTILAVGRASPEKGLVEAAEALLRILPGNPDWSATFVVSEPERFPDYFAKLKSTLSGLGNQAHLVVGCPFARVKALNESAAIALIPSKWREPFGRTCLEAHAGGAAVVSSGSGGLREISGDDAAYLPSVDVDAIAESVLGLIADDSARESLARSGRERVARLFGLDQVSGELDRFCIGIVSSRALRSLPREEA